MTADLVAELRECRQILIDAGIAKPFDGSLYIRAADEIERLRNVIGHATALLDTKHVVEARDVLRLGDDVTTTQPEK